MLHVQTVADFSSVLREKEEAIAKQKALNAEMKRIHEEQLARNETINAFRVRSRVVFVCVLRCS